MALGNLLLRALTAVVLIPLVLALVIWAPDIVFTAVVAALALLTLHEYLSLADKVGAAPLRVFSYIAVVLVTTWAIATPAAAVVLVALGLVMIPRRGLETSLSGAASSVLGVLYIGLPLAMLVQLRMQPRGPQWVIYVLVLTWISDISAYFAGKSIGRHKLAPRVSPGKTWEGSIASAIAATLFGVFYARYFAPDFPLTWSIATALAVNVAGQIGDLAESALKRGAGVKDSSTLLPGHGGMLDRIDALLFAVPTLWYILSLHTVRFFAPLP